MTKSWLREMKKPNSIFKLDFVFILFAMCVLQRVKPAKIEKDVEPSVIINNSENSDPKCERQTTLEALYRNKHGDQLLIGEIKSLHRIKSSRLTEYRPRLMEELKQKSIDINEEYELFQILFFSTHKIPWGKKFSHKEFDNFKHEERIEIEYFHKPNEKIFDQLNITMGCFNEFDYHNKIHLNKYLFLVTHDSNWRYNYHVGPILFHGDDKFSIMRKLCSDCESPRVSFYTEKNWVHAVEGKAFCNATGKPVPELSWTKFGKDIRSVPGRIIKQIFKNSTHILEELYMPYVHQYFGGYHLCIAENIIGRSEQEILEYVDYNPDAEKLYKEKIWLVIDQDTPTDEDCFNRGKQFYLESDPSVTTCFCDENYYGKHCQYFNFYSVTDSIEMPLRTDEIRDSINGAVLKSLFVTLIVGAVIIIIVIISFIFIDRKSSKRFYSLTKKVKSLQDQRGRSLEDKLIQASISPLKFSKTVPYVAGLDSKSPLLISSSHGNMSQPTVFKHSKKNLANSLNFLDYQSEENVSQLKKLST